jgi:3-phenylpropionate/cinnamic acid dioxygenase small subunit
MPESNGMMSDSDIAKFLFREAVLMDEHRYEEWLALWTGDGVYWIPCAHEDADPLRHVSIIYDNRAKLGDRVARLQSGGVLAQDPKPRMRRVISNIEIARASDTEATVASNFVLIQARGADQTIWCGRSIHTLREQDGGIKIARKKVLLVNSEQEMPVLQFLI